MPRVALYKSAVWLRKKYKIERLTLKEIAELCGCTEMTISNYVNKFGLNK